MQPKATFGTVIHTVAITANHGSQRGRPLEVLLTPHAVLDRSLTNGSMRISKIRINNFADFGEFEVETGENLVIVGENKVGKSNFLFALQLILDPGLSDRDRQLDLEHFWDGLGDDKRGSTSEISVGLTDFDDDPRLLAHLGNCLVDPRTADGVALNVSVPAQG